MLLKMLNGIPGFRPASIASLTRWTVPFTASETSAMVGFRFWNGIQAFVETKIPLGDVRGRIDHMAVDLKRQRLFVAELGNDSVGIVDLPKRKLISRIPGLKEPQGVGYEPPRIGMLIAERENTKA
jgi:hypothetical protein